MQTLSDNWFYVVGVLVGGYLWMRDSKFDWRSLLKWIPSMPNVPDILSGESDIDSLKQKIEAKEKQIVELQTEIDNLKSEAANLAESRRNEAERLEALAK